LALALAFPASAQDLPITLGGHLAANGPWLSSRPAVASSHQTLLDQWRGYALSGITPEFGWSERASVAPPSLARQYAPATLPLLGAGERSGGASAVSIAIRTAMASESPALPAGQVATGAISDGLLGSGLQRVFITPSFTQAFGESGSWTLSAILAHQRFASLGMGSVAWTPAFHGMMGSRYVETSAGAGARLEVSDALGERVTWAVALQSRLDMDTFKSYRGVFSDSGDFDVPGHAAAGFNLGLAEGFRLGLGVQRVFYSDIAAFTSAALPVRFLALLGDATSPEFAWRDLTVYSATLAWDRSARETWSFRYTTRQQPAPTSAMLRQALEPEFTDTNLALAFHRDLGRFGQLIMAASYAPKQYFLATGPFFDRAHPGRDQREIEMHWGFQF
jgi:hypothetical protein